MHADVSYSRELSNFRPSTGGPRGSDKGRIKSEKDRESALEAVRALTKPQNEKPQNEKAQNKKPRNEKSQVTQVWYRIGFLVQ